MQATCGPYTGFYTFMEGPNWKVMEFETYLHSRPGKVMQIRKICLSHENLEFHIFLKIIFS